MIFCDENKLILGCHNPCFPLVINALSVSTNTYTLQLESNRITQIISAQIAGSLLQFDTSALNQNMNYNAKVFLGTVQVLFDDGAGLIYDSFVLQTTVGGQPAPLGIALMPSA